MHNFLINSNKSSKYLLDPLSLSLSVSVYLSGVCTRMCTQECLCVCCYRLNSRPWACQGNTLALSHTPPSPISLWSTWSFQGSWTWVGYRNVHHIPPFHWGWVGMAFSSPKYNEKQGHRSIFTGIGLAGICPTSQEDKINLITVASILLVNIY